MTEINDKDLLLVVDMQNVYLPGNEWACVDVENVITYIKEMLEYFPENQIVFTQFLPPAHPQGTWEMYNIVNKEINRECVLSEYMEEFLPYLKEDNLYSKSVYSCCGNQEFCDKIMQYERIFITGVVAECCVLSTVFDLIDMGKKIVYLKRGIAGGSKEKEEAAMKVLEGLSPLHILFR